MRTLGELCQGIVRVPSQLTWKPRWIAQPWLPSGMKLISRNCRSERWKNCVLAANWPRVEEEEEERVWLGSTGAAGELLAPCSSFPSLLGPETWSNAQLDQREDLNVISCWIYLFPPLERRSVRVSCALRVVPSHGSCWDSAGAGGSWISCSKPGFWCWPFPQWGRDRYTLCCGQESLCPFCPCLSGGHGAVNE